MFRACAVLLPLLLLTAPAQAGEFRIEGDDIKSAKLVFDGKGIDRSSAKGTAKGLLEVYASIRSSSLEFKFQSMLVENAKQMLEPLLTSEAYNTLLGKEEEKVRQVKQLMSKLSVKSEVQFTNEETKDGVTTLHYLLVIKMRAPCRSCLRAEKADPACKRCKGTGMRDRERKANGAVLLKQKEKLWLVTAMKTECYRCNGTGKARNTPPRPHKCSGAATCAVCNAGGGDCTTCESTGLRDDSFFRGPKQVKNPPTVDVGKPDQTSPEKAFASFSAALQARRLTQKLLESQLGKGFDTFVTFFCHPDHKPERKVAEVKLTEYRALEVHKDGADVARVNFARFTQGNQKMASKVAGKVELRKGGDGKWRVSGVLNPCWACGSGPRAANPAPQPGGAAPPPCSRCKGTGFQKADYLP